MIDHGDEAGFRKEAERCRRLAAGVADALTAERLGSLANEYDQRAERTRLDARPGVANKPIMRG